MSLRAKLLCCTCVLAIGISAAPGRAQNVGGILNLMGEMIEQDMRNQQQRRRMEAEDRRHREHQQSIRRQEQARQNEIRRQEMALVRRLQTALSKLGFYTSKVDGDRGPGTKKAEALFLQAFGYSQIALDEYSIAEIEELAERGFRSADELRIATDAGFGTRDDYVGAKEGGFESAHDYRAARESGFKTFDEFRGFKLSGFDEPADYRVAAQGGFTQRSEFETAREAGFSEKAEFLKFQESGHADRKSYETAMAAEATARKISGECGGAVKENEDLATTLDTCLEAVVSGASADMMLPHLEQFQSRISDELKQLSEEAAIPSTEVASTDNTTVSTAPNAATFLVNRAKLLDSQRQLECGMAVVAKSWTNVSDACQSISEGQTSAAVQKLHSFATTEMKAAEEVAAKELQARQKAAEVEQQRLALEAAHVRMESLLSDMALFTESKRSLKSPLDVAKAVVRLRQLEESQDFKAIEQALIYADDLLKSEPDFQSFLIEKQKANEVALVNARTTAVAELRRTTAFIGSFVGANLLHESVNDLLQLQEKVAGALGSGQDEQAFNMQKTASAEIERLDLASELAAFIYEENAPAQAEVQQAANGLAVTEMNRELLEGDRKDVLILGNFTAQAPHLLVDLTGKTTFDLGNVDYCWIGTSPTQAPLIDHVLPILRDLGGEQFRGHGSCAPSDVLNADVVLVERGAFLNQNVLDVQPILDAFESSDLKTIDTVAWSAVGASAEDDKRLAATIRGEVLGNARAGFGLVRFDNATDGLCLVVNADEVEFHQRAIAIRATDLERFLPKDLTSAPNLSLERAFAAVQRRTCAAVYASEADMARLLEALEKVDIAHSVVPVWIDPDMIAEGKALSLSSEEEKQKEIAARRQELEAAEALRKKQSEGAEVVRANRQRELREQYSQESRAAYNELSELSKQYLQDGSNTSTIFPSLFPSIGQWKANWTADSWVLDKYDDQLVDYGTAEWKGRRLEAVAIRTSITTKNAIRGEYSEACFVIGYLIDSEFEVRRDALVEPCETASPALDQWRSSRSFESRWVASVD